MEKLTWKEQAMNKSNELKIPPNLLFIALGAIAENNNVNDQQILKKYWEYLLLEYAELSIASKSKRRREIYEMSMTSPDPMFIDLADIPTLHTFGRLSDYIQISDVKKVHIEVFNSMVTQCLKIKKRYMRKTNQFQIHEIIKALCPELITRLREIGINMKNDFCYN